MAYCKWCGGRGCIACPSKKDLPEELPQSIFSAKRDNPRDMELLKQFFGREAIEHAFGENGGGMEEIERNAAIARAIQFIDRKEENSK